MERGRGLGLIKLISYELLQLWSFLIAYVVINININYIYIYIVVYYIDCEAGRGLSRIISLMEPVFPPPPGRERNREQESEIKREEDGSCLFPISEYPPPHLLKLPTEGGGTRQHLGSKNVHIGYLVPVVGSHY
jgi:hypothetical protein